MADNVFALMPPAWLRQNFLAGIDLTDQSGNPYPDSMYENAIRQALAYAEKRLNISIQIRTYIKQRYSQFYEDRNAFYAMRLNHAPLLSVEAVQNNFGNLKVLELPLQWVLITSFRFADIKIVPVLGNAQITQVLAWPAPWNRAFNPAGWRVSYTAGFYFRTGTFVLTSPDTEATVTLPATLEDSDYTVYYSLVNPAEADENIEIWTKEQAPGEFTAEASATPSVPLTVRWYATAIPEDLLQYIGLQAAISILPMLGSNLIGSGLGSRSISQDGLSQSFSTFPGGYKAQLDQFKAQADMLESTLRATYTPANISVR